MAKTSAKRPVFKCPSNTFPFRLQILKRHCRQLGIVRWPYRKVKSLQGLIGAIEGFGAGDTSLGKQVRGRNSHRTGMSRRFTTHRNQSRQQSAGA